MSDRPEYPLSDDENMGRHGFVRCPVAHGPEPCEVCDSTGWIKNRVPYVIDVPSRYSTREQRELLEDRIIELNVEASRYEDDATEARRIAGELERERNDAFSLLIEWLRAAPRLAPPGLLSILEDNTRALLGDCGKLGRDGCAACGSRLIGSCTLPECPNPLDAKP